MYAFKIVCIEPESSGRCLSHFAICKHSEFSTSLSYSLIRLSFALSLYQSIPFRPSSLFVSYPLCVYPPFLFTLLHAYHSATHWQWKSKKTKLNEAQQWTKKNLETIVEVAAATTKIQKQYKFKRRTEGGFALQVIQIAWNPFLQFFLEALKWERKKWQTIFLDSFCIICYIIPHKSVHFKQKTRTHPSMSQISYHFNNAGLIIIIKRKLDALDLHHISKI